MLPENKALMNKQEVERSGADLSDIPPPKVVLVRDGELIPLWDARDIDG